MQNIREVLRHKEVELEQLQKEIEALRLSIRILEDEEACAPRTGARNVETMPLKDSVLRTGVSLKQFP